MYGICRVLEPGMVITVEPGCYFGRYLLEPAMLEPDTAPYFIKSRIESMLVRHNSSTISFRCCPHCRHLVSIQHDGVPFDQL
jgi:hypothetical protein